MSKVALRVYNRDIEAMIDRGQIEEAVAHCQHILKTYPKHLETYRLLGKAYLESHRYADAADIFQRVLLAAPDDFVSHLGMSIVCDEQKDLNGAVWHMERAFEINSTNSGVQAELRRLIGRRDGLEPPKIYLTRGALAQIYVKGGEYQQAIAEIKSVLAEDPSRNDMKTLLARAYFRAGMKTEAVEHCIDLLKQYPYSLDGNRILVEILPGTSMAQGVEQYKRRIQSLEPYAAVASGSVFDTDAVPDIAVEIERLEWDPGARPADNWSIPNPAQTAESQDTPALAAPADEIPDWMQQSGWGASTGEFKDGPVNFDEPETPAASAPELAAAEIPDWLKAMAPPGASPAAPAPDNPVEADEAADFDWLAGLGAPAAAAVEKPENVDEPVSFGAPADDEALASEDLDWLNNLGVAAGTASAANDLDWLKSATPAAEDQPADALDTSLPDWMGEINLPEDSGAVEQTPAAQPATNDVPDWLSGLSAAEPEKTEPAGQAAGDVPDWLSSLSATETEKTGPVEQPVSGDVPDWLSSLGEPAAEASAAASDVPDWLGNLSASEPEKTEPVDLPATGDVPDWLSGLGEQAAELEKTEPVSETPVEQPTVGDVPDWLSSLGEPAAEALAAASDVPDWLGDLSASEPEKTEPVSQVPVDLPAAGDVPDWLSGLGEQAAELEKTEPVSETPLEQSTAGDVPDWLSSLGEPAAEASAVASDVPDWLGDLSASEPEKTEPVSQAPVELPAAGDAPDWLSGISEDAAEPEKTEPISETPAGQASAGDVPDWLSGLAVPAAEAAAEAQGTLEAPIVEQPRAEDELSALVTGPGTSESEQDAALKWLESLAEKQGAKADELITNPSERQETAPDWVSQDKQEPVAAMAETGEPEAAAPAVEQSRAEDELSALVTGPGTSESEQDAALKWLESLAEKQGAKAEELITNPSERQETAPDWISQDKQEPVAAVAETVEPEAAASTVEQPRAEDELSALVTGPGTSESEQDAALKWLESLAEKQGAKAEELITNPSERQETAPEWVAGAQDKQEPVAAVAETVETEAAAPVVEQPRAEDELSALVTGPGTSESEQDAALKWLESLAEKQGAKADELITNPSERQETAPDWVAGAQDKQEPVAAMAEPVKPEAAAPVVETPRAEDELSALVTGPGTSESEQDAALKWLESLAEKQGAKAEELITNPSERQETAPDWVSQDKQEPVAALAETVEPEAAASTVEQPRAEDELSALVTGPGTSESEQDAALKWLESLAEKQGAKAEELITNPSERQETAPEWVAGAQDKQEPVAAVAETVEPEAAALTVEQPRAEDELSALVTGPGTSESEQDAALKWLESLAEKQGAKADELITNPSERQETAPDWVAGAQDKQEPVAAMAEPVKPEAAAPVVETPSAEQPRAEDELSALVTGPGTSESEQDAALKWLESLAEKQGAKADELITNPSERQETAPDWVSQGKQEPVAAVTEIVEPEAAAPVVETPTAEQLRADDELSALVTGPGTSESEQDAALKWLESLAEKQGAKAEELITNPSERQETAPEWVAGAQDKQEPVAAVAETVEAEAAAPVVETPAVEQPRAEDELSALVTGPGTSESEQDAALKWLESLAEKQGAKAEELITNPSERQETAPDWISLERQEPVAAAADAVEPAQDDSLGWLDDLAGEEPAAEASQPVSAAEDDGLDWLGDLSTPAGQPASALPWEQAEPLQSDVQPAEQAADESAEWFAELGQDAGEAAPTEEPVAAEADQSTASALQPETPDWLSGIEQVEETKSEEPASEQQAAPVAESDDEIPQSSADISAWLNGLADDEEAPAAQDEDVNPWLAEEDQPVAEQSKGSDVEELPDWLKDTSTDDQPPVPQPVSNWIPSVPYDDDDEEVEEEQAASEQSEPEPVETVAAQPEPVSSPPVMRQPGALGTDKDAMSVQAARDLLAHGGLNGAMNEYTKLIKKGRLLEEVIYDLQEAVYSHPVDVIVWQTLGDAYFRTNRLQEALDAYGKAEGLLR